MGHFPETIERRSDRLLVFFTGWGMDWHATRHLSLDGFDLVVLYDYTHPVQWSLPCGYSEYHLAAWSLGVWAAAEWCMASGLPGFTSATAINGTLSPIDQERGIPPKVFDGTIANWGDANARRHFMMRLAGSRQSAESYPLGDRSPESQQAELRSIAGRVRSAQGVAPANVFTRALVSTRDRIFPPQSQMAHWSALGTPLLELDAPHSPFELFTSWNELLSLGEPN